MSVAVDVLMRPRAVAPLSVGCAYAVARLFVAPGPMAYAYAYAAVRPLSVPQSMAYAAARPLFVPRSIGSAYAVAPP